MNTPARFRLCELRRAEKVAEESGRIVKISGGEIFILPTSGEIGENQTNEVELVEECDL